MKKKSSKRQLKLSQLERKAFPNHEVSVTQLLEGYHEVLREAVAKVDKKLLAHIRRCKHCQRQIQLLEDVDPLWKMDGELQKVLIEIIKRF